ncbi:MAG: hypothetical protein Q4G09_06170, partial [Clostridia bacterium]|nr:hypothetical protein [Clostridia bacterium]
WYKAVTKEGTSVEENTNGGNLFLTGNADKVRMLTLPEINNTRAEATTINSTETIETEPAPGLFKLDQLKKITGLTGYTYNNGGYWLASPYSSGPRSVHYVYYNGYVDSSYNYTYGARPVVFLGSDISYKVERESENGFSYLVLSKDSAE